MGSDETINIDYGAADAQIATFQGLIANSRAIHNGFCQQLEQDIWGGLSAIPSIRDPLMNFVQILRQRHEHVSGYYEESWLPLVKNITANAETVKHDIVS